MKLAATAYRFSLLWMTLLTGGCADRVLDQSTFRLNRVTVRRYELDLDERFTQSQLSDLQESLSGLFGTPNEPRLPEEETLRGMVDRDLLRMAAGPVPAATTPSTSVGGAGQGEEPAIPTGGLYRRHCAHCHGISGDGAGPSAEWMNPYPRDFRPGVFQYKSTPLGRRPTDDDLRRIVVNGSPGTAMPAFDQLPDHEIEALVAYVKYLAIRGETERVLIDFSSDLNADDGERLDTSDEFLVDEIVAAVAEMWEAAEDFKVEVPPWPELNFAASAQRGREIYFSEAGGCAKCHGPTGLGDGQDTYYDYWSEQLEPAQDKRLREYVALGALPPRPIVPHNLRSGIYRGGRRPIDLYWRIRNGIDGTPMPVASMKAPGAKDDAAGLTADEIWHLVDYVRSLPYESISRPSGVADPALARDSAAEPNSVFARVTVRQFDWQIQYPGDDGRLNTRDDVHAVNELRVPPGEDRTVVFASGDVRHRIHLPDWKIRRTIVPGKPVRVELPASAEGSRALLRDAQVGRGHSPVAARVVVESDPSYGATK